ncbi:MAG: hypothetical protein JST42_09000 [Bacteroidetes bacterium]|nr:hypothetical protein [Bacteroidota bacterium]
MKTITLLLVASFFMSFTANAQIQKGNVMVGGDISRLDLSLNSGNNFSFLIDPKAAWFIQDNLAIGAFLNFDLTTAKGAGSNISYGIGPLARYYISDPKIEVLRHSRFFLEGNVGIQGTNPHVGPSTNGLGIGFGPGLAYFITRNIGLEALLKYQAIVGFGSSATSSDLLLGLGFQIYLPKGRIEKASKEER